MTGTEGGSGAAQRFYGRWATLYDWVARFTPRLSHVRDRTAAALALEPGDTVVEMGCGTGANFPHVWRRIGPSGRLIGVDFTEPMLARARRDVRRNGWENVDVVRADASRFELAEPVDAVLATFVVGMLSDPAATIDRWLDLLKPGGTLVLMDARQSPNPYMLPANLAFRALVIVSMPEKRLSYETAPWDVLDGRVAEAREALARRTTVTTDETFALGTVRLTAGRK